MWSNTHDNTIPHTHTGHTPPLIEKASRNGAWMPRLCYTQAKATPHAYRARRTIPLFTQLYAASPSIYASMRKHACVYLCVCCHYGLVPSLFTACIPVSSVFSLCLRVLCTSPLLPNTKQWGSATPPATFRHKTLVCLCVRRCVWLGGFKSI